MKLPTKTVEALGYLSAVAGLDIEIQLMISAITTKMIERRSGSVTDAMHAVADVRHAALRTQGLETCPGCGVVVIYASMVDIAAEGGEPEECCQECARKRGVFERPITETEGIRLNPRS